METSGLLQVLAGCPFGNTGVANAPEVRSSHVAIKWALRDTLLRGFYSGYEGLPRPSLHIEGGAQGGECDKCMHRDGNGENDVKKNQCQADDKVDHVVKFKKAMHALITLAVIACSHAIG